jgi:transcription initiation factor TFIIIB Brf1 subunit/transcription initiation factor TFIIB
MSVLTQRKCPHCGATDSLEVDYLRGEVACNECAIVCETGLLEDPRTVFDEDGAVPTTGSRGPRVSTAAGGVEHSRADAKSTRAYQIMKAIRDRTGVPEAVVEGGQSLFDRYIALATANNLAAIEPVLCATTCFYISATLRFYPVQPTELASYSFLKGITPSKIDAAKTKLISELNLRTEWEAAAASFYENLVALYARRLRPKPLTPKQCRVAVAVAKVFVKRVSGKAPGAVVQFAIVQALTNVRGLKPLHEFLGTMPDSAADDVAKPKIVEAVAAAARESPDALKAMVATYEVDTVNHSTFGSDALAELRQFTPPEDVENLAATGDEPLARDRKRERD